MTNGSKDPKQVLTARDVAQLMGVSTSMISRAFNPEASISPTMRKRIMEASAALGYRPNVIARSLSTRSSKIVAIIVGTLENPFYAQVLEKLSRELQLAGYQSLLFSLAPGQDVDSQLPFLVQYNVDAVVIVSASISSGIANDWTRSGRKVILFNRTLPDASIPSVCCDNFTGAKLAVDHFVERGRRRLAFAAGRRDTSTNAERELGFISRLAELGKPFAAKADNPHCSFQDGYNAALKLAAHKPDAIFFANDVMALGGIEAIRKELGLNVPDDIAVIGFDDIPMAAWPTYSLTTIRQPLDAMVESAVDLVSDQSGVDELRVVHPVQLVERASTKATSDEKVP
ncbi:MULTISPECIES: LacI family DNA-binding transcriptional regulator [Aminobacter]|uniref:DNA-binding LacI/PurR family transcriptional regulator n=1 Tax=Aminobacter ciceronei TaxID=150723 RepID=A0ABR6CAZ4_9HYPH|nr:MULTISPECIES: LacI family DNA-binding transcriptional regulator [Aminobacter]MBA8908317.1 DNA-binding LacI/PurR family transcriptional regulator [Aminobacter ciceronei]MBA9022089.1 DNA-binding LacI/PurR family transcriptional regulator [Aminobacter ciceronei]QNH34777.1 LacI family DNA-binding transcriptional regulator [Aminobacter sp. MDW-2]